jgi:hypothetical protein
MNYREAIENKINGNVSTWRKWVKNAKKVDILNAIECACGEYGILRHIMINDMRSILEK